jgi:glycosyltransferase involved in cell wall biosynthesis
MKVLLVNTLYHPQELGGAERVVKRIADALPQFGVEPEVACLAADGRPVTEIMDGVTVHRLRLRNVYPLYPLDQRRGLLKPLWHLVDSANVAMSRALTRVVERVRPALVHTHNVTGFSPLIWRELSRRGIPVVHTLHDHYLLCPRGTMYHRGANCSSRHLSCAPYSIARLLHSSRIAAVVGVSQYILARHLAYGAFSGASRSVIRNPVAPVRVLGARTESDGALRIGFLGRLDPAKGLDVLLGASQTLSRRDWTIDIGGVGHPDYERALRSQFEEPRIRFLGHVRSDAFLQSVDVLVVPSLWHEPLPLVVIEALAAGVPVIASRVGGIPEVVVEGQTGFLVLSGQQAELRSVLERVIETPAIVRSMRAACVASAAPFAPGVIASEYAALYRATVAAPLRNAALK